MKEHTKGPWVVEPCYRSGYTIWGGTNAEPICVVDTQDDEGRYGVIRNEADAFLIAAAPELLEALQELYEDEGFGRCVTETSASLKAKLAIAKAKGE